MTFTCNYCGETLDGSEYANHVAEHNDATDTLVDTRYNVSTIQEARDTWIDHLRDMDPRY